MNIFSSSTALLNKLAFEGATKRNKPELKKGDVLYLLVSVADKDLDTEVTCISSSGSKKEWSTGETVITHLLLFLMQCVFNGALSDKRVNEIHRDCCCCPHIFCCKETST